MFPGPVFFHELRAAARRKRTFVVRFLIGAFLLFLVLQIASRTMALHEVILSARLDGRAAERWEQARSTDYTHAELASAGRALFEAILYLEFLVVLALTPAYLAGSIAEERQRKVLSYLLASPMTGAEIVLGKFAARLVNLGTLVMMGLPMLSLSSFLGGVEPRMIWLGSGVLFTSICLIGAASVCVSFYSARPRDAIVRCYFLLIAWLLLPILLEILRSVPNWAQGWAQGARPVTDWVEATSPTIWLFLSWMLQPGDEARHFAVMMGLQGGLALAFLGWATLRLRRVERGPLGGKRRKPGLFWSRGMRTQPVRLMPRRPVGDRPMIWKECSSSFLSGSPVKLTLTFLVGVAAVAGVSLVFGTFVVPAFKEMMQDGYAGYSSARQDLNEAIRVLTAIFYGLGELFIAISAATSFSGERERDSWISLVATPMDGREIVAGKYLGAFWQARAWLAAMLLCWIVGAVCGAVHPLGLVLAVLECAIYLPFAASLGTYCSLRCKTSARSISWTVCLLLLLNGGYLFCCATGGWGPDRIVLAGVTPLSVASAPFSRLELEQFLRGVVTDDSSTSNTVACALFSFSFYGLAAVGLYQMCLARFETVADRPWRPESRPVSAEGITFLEDDRPEEPD